MDKDGMRGRTHMEIGWRPIYREFDWDYFLGLATCAPQELTQRGFNVLSKIAGALGRTNHTWWANALELFSENTMDDIQKFWQYITPPPPLSQAYFCKKILSANMKREDVITRNNIPLDLALKQLEELIMRRVLTLLGKPTMITTYYCEWGGMAYYPVEKFRKWEDLEDGGARGYINAYWAEHDTWLQIGPATDSECIYTLLGENSKEFIRRATQNIAIGLSGYKCQIGSIESLYPLSSFPEDIRDFTSSLREGALREESGQTTVLITGEPGTGKTMWTQALAKEVLVPEGYTIMILDHDALEHFIPPSYLSKVCLIINEVDNLAQNRASAAAQRNGRTEHILSLLDGTISLSINSGAPNRRLVILMTANTTERLDPALLRKGRVDTIREFTHKFV